MQTTVLIAGAGTACGREVVREFAHRGHGVRATVRTLDDRPRLDGVDDDVEWYAVDWRAAKERAEDVMAGARIVVDATGGASRAFGGLDRALRESVSTTRAVLRTAERHRVGRAIYLADSLVLGRTNESDGERGEPRSEEHNYVPGTAEEWPVAEAAYAAQMEAYRFVQRGVPVVLAIPGLPVGPGAMETAVGRHLDSLWRERLPVGLDVEINVVDSRDVASAVASLATDGRPGRRFVLGGENITLEDLFDRAADVADVDPPDRLLPVSLADRAGSLIGRVSGGVDRVLDALAEAPRAAPTSEMSGWLSSLRRLSRATPLDSERAENELGHRPRPIRRTLVDTFERWRQDRSSC